MSADNDCFVAHQPNIPVPMSMRSVANTPQVVEILPSDSRWAKRIYTSRLDTASLDSWRNIDQSTSGTHSTGFRWLVATASTSTARHWIRRVCP